MNGAPSRGRGVSEIDRDVFPSRCTILCIVCAYTGIFQPKCSCRYSLETSLPQRLGAHRVLIKVMMVYMKENDYKRHDQCGLTCRRNDAACVKTSCQLSAVSSQLSSQSSRSLSPPSTWIPSFTQGFPATVCRSSRRVARLSRPSTMVCAPKSSPKSLGSPSSSA